MIDRNIQLYLVPTPIGNLEDITLRAIRILGEVDFILVEDTRTSQVLLNHLGIKKPLYPHHKFNEHKAVQGIISRLNGGEKAAMISDAGTPGISDPGFLLVRACLEAGLEVECLPGATALIPALINSGFPCERFVFEGFLPLKKGKQTRIRELSIEPRTIILYESPMRLVKILGQLVPEFGGGRRASVSRELTKMHEETIRGTLDELIVHFTETAPRGEIVIVIEGV
ncbi:MAG: 16S rRNA (cytidine(1402)-2'-O)-methyltransferase [Porphyromonadaceae bacterium]|nr:MAG: 16S rRNA (cytidine(1402)-2'-O)-methyltransferase [Porphyromonadaceae bacterium]